MKLEELLWRPWPWEGKPDGIVLEVGKTSSHDRLFLWLGFDSKRERRLDMHLIVTSFFFFCLYLLFFFYEYISIFLSVPFISKKRFKKYIKEGYKN